MKDIQASVINNIPVAEGIFKMRLNLGGESFGKVQPGQFVQLEVPNAPDLLLRRPISINGFDEEKNILTLIYQHKGRGTVCLSQLKPGESIKVLGSLGNGFWPKVTDRTVYIVGGGIGVAPLKYYAEKWPEVRYKAFLGFKGKKFTYQLEDWEKLVGKNNLFVVSEDGSIGEKGFVTGPLERELRAEMPDLVIACGPAPMLRALQKVMDAFPQIHTLASLEERMGCGIGACLVCNCRIRVNGEETYRRVCADGPVFDLREVIFA